MGGSAVKHFINACNGLAHAFRKVRFLDQTQLYDPRLDLERQLVGVPLRPS